MALKKLPDNRNIIEDAEYDIRIARKRLKEAKEFKAFLEAHLPQDIKEFRHSGISLTGSRYENRIFLSFAIKYGVKGDDKTQALADAMAFGAKLGIRWEQKAKQVWVGSQSFVLKGEEIVFPIEESLPEESRVTISPKIENLEAPPTCKLVEVTTMEPVTKYEVHCLDDFFQEKNGQA